MLDLQSLSLEHRQPCSTKAFWRGYGKQWYVNICIAVEQLRGTLIPSEILSTIGLRVSIIFVLR